MVKSYTRSKSKKSYGSAKGLEFMNLLRNGKKSNKRKLKGGYAGHPVNGERKSQCGGYAEHPKHQKHRAMERRQRGGFGHCTGGNGPAHAHASTNNRKRLSKQRPMLARQHRQHRQSGGFNAHQDKHPRHRQHRQSGGFNAHNKEGKQGCGLRRNTKKRKSLIKQLGGFVRDLSVQMFHIGDN